MSILRYKQKLLPLGNPQGGGKGGGGGGQTQQQQNQYTNLTPWAQPYITSVLGAAQQQVFNTKPTSAIPGTPATYDSEGNQTFAGTAGTPAGNEITGIRPYNAYGSFNDQGGQYGINPSAQAAANSAVAGFQPLQNQAYQGASNLSQSQAPNLTGAAAYGSFGAGQNLANQSTNPYAVGAYMNPYIQNALQPQLAEMNRQYDITGNQMQGRATSAGAFGGNRAALEQSENQRNKNMAMNQVIGSSYNQAYGNAQNQMNTVANLGLQGYGQAGSLAGQQLMQQQGILGLQNQFGGQQQQQAQNVINAGMSNYQQAQQYPMQQLGQLKGLLTGIPVTDVTTTQQQAAPSATSQLAGLGTAGVAGLALANKAAEGGLMKSYAAGGEVKGYAPGGIANLNRKALLNPTSISPKQLQASTKDGAIAPQVSGIAQAIQLNEKVHGDNAAAEAKGMPQGTIMDELRAQAAQKDEQEAMADVIPKAIEVLKQKIEVALQSGDTEAVQRYTQEIQQLAAMLQQPQQQEQAQQPAPSAPAPAGIDQIAANGGQPPQQGIEAAPSNLPTQTMAQGGIVGYANRGLVDEDAEDAEMKQLFGSGTDNDFVQAIMPSAGGYAPHPSAAIQMREEASPLKSAKGSHKYEAEVIKAAKRIGLPENIALHALYKETGGLKDPESARSKAGAIGVMQLMPRTAKELGVNPHNPLENIEGGVSYLKKMYDKYQDPSLTLMAYNAGPGRLDRALRSKEGISSLKPETLNYVKMAQGGVAHFKNKGKVSQEEYDASSLADDLSMVDQGIDNPYLQRSRSVVEGVKSLGDVFTDPSNYNPVSKLGFDKVPEMYKKYIGEPTSRFFSMTPEEQAAAFKKASDARKEYLFDYTGSSSPTATTAAPAAPVSTGIAGSSVVNPAASLIAGESIVNPVQRQIQQAIKEVKLNEKAPEEKPLEKAVQQYATEPSSMAEIQRELLDDIRARRAEAKKTRETNNLLAIMQGGFGAAASKNINPLAAIAEGGSQGVGTLVGLRKQEADEAKDIAAQQLGLYKYKAASEAEAAKASALERYREATLGKKPDVEDVINGKIEKAMQSNPQIRDLRERMQLDAKNGMLTPEIEARYQTAINKIIASIYKRYGTNFETVDVGTITPTPPPKKPSFFDSINPFGSSAPEPTPGWGPVTVKQQ